MPIKGVWAVACCLNTKTLCVQVIVCGAELIFRATVNVGVSVVVVGITLCVVVSYVCDMCM